MARHIKQLTSPFSIAQARSWFDRAAALGWTVEFREPKRSDDQNARFWELLGRVAKTITINGKTFEPDQWKMIFMRAMGKEAQFLPTLDGESFFPTGFRSSQLTVREMADLQTFIEAHCAAQGVDIWADQERKAG